MIQIAVGTIIQTIQTLPGPINGEACCGEDSPIDEWTGFFNYGPSPASSTLYFGVLGAILSLVGIAQFIRAYAPQFASVYKYRRASNPTPIRLHSRQGRRCGSTPVS
jgi:hypothetical protein